MSQQLTLWDSLNVTSSPVSAFGATPYAAPDGPLRRHYPELWQHMLAMESWLPEGDLGRRFKAEATVSDLDARFAAEDAHRANQILLPGMDALHA